MYEFVSRGLFEPNLERVIGLLRVRRDAMLAALDSEPPGGAGDASRTAATSCGSQLDGVDVGRARRAPRSRASRSCRAPDFGGDPDTLRLAFSFVSPEEIGEGVARLAAALPRRAVTTR